MSKCETCGSQGSNLFEVVKDGVARKFDSFECAIESMAIPCKNCGCLITGRQFVADGNSYCCDVCRQHAEVRSHQMSGSI